MKFSTDIILERVTKEEILARVTEYDIYSYYMPYKFTIGHITSSPFREDKHPSFGIFKSSKTGSLLFKDQATGEVGDCFKFVQLLRSLGFNDTLNFIWSDIVDNSLYATSVGKYIDKVYKNKKKLISVKRRNFTRRDDDYWEQYHIIRDTLKKFNVSPINMFWVDDVLSSIRYTKEHPLYAYRVFNSFKIYNPLTDIRGDKWRTNCGINDIQGWEQLPDKGDLLIITKSLKDVMVLSLFNIPSIAPQGEHNVIPKKVIEEAKKRFKTIVTLYDYDEAGIMGSSKVKEMYGIPNIFVPIHYLELYNVKDISDHIKDFGYDKTQTLLNQLLNDYKS